MHWLKYFKTTVVRSHLCKEQWLFVDTARFVILKSCVLPTEYISMIVRSKRIYFLVLH